MPGGELLALACKVSYSNFTEKPFNIPVLPVSDSGY